MSRPCRMQSRSVLSVLWVVAFLFPFGLRADDAKPAAPGEQAQAGDPAPRDEKDDEAKAKLAEHPWEKDPPPLDLEMSAEEWKKQLRAWREEVGEPLRWTKDALAVMDKIRAVKDPAAVEAILALLDKEKNTSVRFLYIQALGRTGSKKAIAPLAKLAVEDEQPDIRHEAAKSLGTLPDKREALPQLIRYLGSKHSARAAQALRWSGLTQRLGTFESPDSYLTRALINALIVKKKTRVPVGYWYAWWKASAVPGGRHMRGHFESGIGTKDVDVPAPNPEVLEALKEYSGQDYEYDVRAWEKWHQERKNSPPDDP
ncbi:MAG: HEAT repeat domain-containing protein [Planctomycetia bacterium]|nr:HEAT repeat domain-containing protein [Planctomycetia bacterium]